MVLLHAGRVHPDIHREELQRLGGVRRREPEVCLVRQIIPLARRRQVGGDQSVVLLLSRLARMR